MNRPAAIIRMPSDRQLRKVRRLIQSLCANYFEGNCVLLGNGYDATVYPQAITYSLCCQSCAVARVRKSKRIWKQKAGIR